MAAPVKNDKLFLNLFIVAFLIIGVLATVFVVKEYSQENRSSAGWYHGVNPDEYVDPDDYSGIQADAEARAEAAEQKAEEAKAKAEALQEKIDSGDFGNLGGGGYGNIPNGADEESITQACEDIVSKYKNELNNYESRKEVAKAKYENAKTNALALLDSADEMGYDTTQARATISDIDTKVVALESEVDTLVAKWKNKRIDCSDTDSYAEVQQELRTDVSTVRKDVNEIRSMIRDVIESVKSQIEITDLGGSQPGGPGHENW